MIKKLLAVFKKEKPTNWNRDDFEKERFVEKLKDHPPKPPWVAYPNVMREDMFWRMGKGEDLLYDLYIYFKFTSESDFEIFMKEYPEHDDWEGWYNECL